MRWNSSMGARIPEAIQYDEWKPSLPENKKRKNAVIDSHEPAANISKKSKATHQQHKEDGTQIHVPPRVVPTSQPTGLIWDGVDHSCGYDATFSILADIWIENPGVWTDLFSNMSELLRLLSTTLQSARLGQITMEQVKKHS
ncbi:hypothetical protein B0H11DRAFT_1926019 [Mycena galericulata]|nr:hypothetical protein B0H11DRAFT_1926019 [Mycena galericulata]